MPPIIANANPSTKGAKRGLVRSQGQAAATKSGIEEPAGRGSRFQNAPKSPVFSQWFGFSRADRALPWTVVTITLPLNSARTKLP